MMERPRKAVLLRTFCGLYDLRTGIIVIGALCIFLSLYNDIPDTALLLTDIPQIRQWFESHPNDTKKYGYDSKLVTEIEIITKFKLGASIIDFVTGIYLLIPATASRGKNYKGMLLIWIGWSNIKMTLSVVYAVWMLKKYAIGLSVLTEIVKLTVDVLLKMYFVLAVVSYYQNIELYGPRPKRFTFQSGFGSSLNRNGASIRRLEEPPPPYEEINQTFGFAQNEMYEVQDY